MNFDAAFERLINPAHEGRELSLDPNDKGNWTSGKCGIGELKGSKFGISAASYPGEDIANLKLERARDIYRRDFWGPAGCDVVPDALKFDLFDMAVNSGPKAAVKCIQRTVGATQDGILGPITLMALQSIPPARFVARFNGARLVFLTGLDAWPTQGRGWARRIAANLLEA